jgi:taurine dioxygenase
MGAELTGLDLTAPLEPGTVAAVRRAVLDRKVVVIPGQHLAPRDLVAFARSFGVLARAHPVLPGLPDHPEVFALDLDAARQVLEQRWGARAGEDWMADLSFLPSPPLGTILSVESGPPEGSELVFADTEAAYDGLSGPVRRLLDGLVAVHSAEPVFAPVRQQFAEQLDALRPVRHPVVRTHPETGRSGLFVNPTFTTGVEGMADSETRGLLAMLYEHLTQPAYVVAFRLRPGDVVFWDNRSTVYRIPPRDEDHACLVHRVTLRGDRPF